VTARPSYHLTPETGFLNDPNGLLRIGDTWHAWYQLSPGPRHGHVSWGHAVSEDLLDWRHLPASIPADDEEEAWSGGIVVDLEDTAGFGAGALVATYTSLRRADLMQRQALASSTDGGLTWTKHGVVLDIGSRDFRDPRVIRHGDRWLMVVVRALEEAVSVYSSPDLHDWTHESDVVMPRGDGPWECPDLFPLGDRWVLLASLEPSTFALVGDLDGTSFRPAGDPVPLDTGPDLYAAVTFSGLPDDRRVMVGWLDSWAYAMALPTTPWRGQLSCARELSLVDGPDGTPYVAQRPLAPTTSVELGPRTELAPGVVASYDGGRVRLERGPEVVPRWAGRWELPSPSPEVEVVLDSHSVEVFTVDGRSASLHTLPTD